MPQNVEIKARARDPERQRKLALEMSDGSPENLKQEDTFFACTRGRLKLRVSGDGQGELIAYEREDTTAPRTSTYVITPVHHPGTLKQVLAAALGIQAVVRKRRRVCLVGQTRIHVDDVEGLGHFLELEVVLEPGQSAESGSEMARDLMERLEIAEPDLVEGAYVDLVVGKPNGTEQ